MELDDYRIPLVIGVTGHRRLDVTDARLLAALTSALTNLRQSFLDTPFIIISPLAEGADRLLARLAMTHLQARLIVPLPLPRDEYERDFATEESRQEFADLLQQADHWFVLPLQESPEDVAKPGEARNRQYGRVGAYVAEHCQILIAVWDGQEVKGTGGTAEIVKWKVEGCVPEAFSSLHEDRYSLDTAEQGMVIHIDPLTHEVTRIQPTGAESLPSSIFGKIDELNRDIKEDVSRYGEGPVMQSKNALLKGAEEKNAAIKENVDFQRLASLYAMTDRLSIRYQNRDNWVIRIIYSIFALALLLFGLIDLIESFVLFYMLSIPIIGILIYTTKKKAIEDKFLDYRALAEGFRVLAFWKLCGVEERVSSNYLSKHRGILSWIRQAIKNVELINLHDRSDQPPLNRAQVLDAVSTLWIEDQLSYFSARKEGLVRWSQRLGGISKALFVVTFTIAVAYFICIVQGLTDKPLIDTISIHGRRLANAITVRDGFQAAIGLSGAIAVVAEAYKRRRAFEELAKQYTLTQQLFLTAKTRLADPIYVPEKVLMVIGKEALMENGEWLWMHRNFPLEIPKG